MHPDHNELNDNYIYRPGILYRLGEAYLNYAEALNECDPGNADILVYLNAAGAEDAALASKTLAELLSFEADEHLTVTVEVFGTEDWQGDFVSSLSDRIRISKNGVQTAAYTGSADRGSAAHLSEFVADTLSGSTANRRALFLWGDNPLSAAELAEALKDAKLDLLALNTQPAHAFEDAYVLRDAADHLIAAAGETLSLIHI